MEEEREGGSEGECGCCVNLGPASMTAYYNILTLAKICDNVCEYEKNSCKEEFYAPKTL